MFIADKLPDSIATNRIFIRYGIEILKIRIMRWNIIYAAEIAAYPYSAFSILENRIYGIVRKWLVVKFFMGDVLCYVTFQDVYTAFRTNPVFWFGYLFNVPYK